MTIPGWAQPVRRIKPFGVSKTIACSGMAFPTSPMEKTPGISVTMSFTATTWPPALLNASWNGRPAPGPGHISYACSPCSASSRPFSSASLMRTGVILLISQSIANVKTKA